MSRLKNAHVLVTQIKKYLKWRLGLIKGRVNVLQIDFAIWCGQIITTEKVYIYVYILHRIPHSTVPYYKFDLGFCVTNFGSEHDAERSLLAHKLQCVISSRCIVR